MAAEPLAPVAPAPLAPASGAVGYTPDDANQPAAQPESPFEGGFTKGGNKVDLATAGAFRGLLKGILDESATATVKAADPEALAAQTRTLSSIGHQGPLPKYAVNINLDNLEAPEEVNSLIHSVAEALKPEVDIARRGKRSHQVTLDAARERFRADEGFMLRRQDGEAVNAEIITATRFVLASARDKTAALAREVVSGEGGVNKMVEFRRSLSQMAAIQLQLHGMAAEAGRALNAFKIKAAPDVMALADGSAAKEVDTPPASVAPTTPEELPLAARETPPEAAPSTAPTPAQPTPATAAQEPAAVDTQGTMDALGLLDTQGGTKGVVELAKSFLELPTPAAQNVMARDSTRRGVTDMVGELWFNYVLSGPATQVVNMTGNAVTMGMSTAERQVAGFWGKLFGFAGKEEGVAMREASAMMQAYWGALGDAWRLANFAFRHGESMGQQTGYQMPMSTLDIWKMSTKDAEAMAAGAGNAGGATSKVSTGRQPAITGANVMNAIPDTANAISQHTLGRNVMNPIELGKRGVLGRATDAVSLMIDLAGGTLRTPSRGLGAMDQFFKTLAYRGALRAAGEREAMASGLSAGERAEYVDNFVNFMPPGNPNAEGFARQVTMTEDLIQNYARGLQKVGSSRLGYLFAPFVRVTANILDYSTQRIAFPIRPSWYKDLSGSDPVKRDLAMAKATTGAMVWMTAFGTASTMYDADEDAPVVVTGAGPSDPKLKSIWRQRGYVEYAVRLGGKDGTWVQYTRLDPGGQILGIAADTVNIMSQSDEATADELGAALIAGIGNNLVNKNYMSSIADAMEVFTSYDPAQWQRWLRKAAASHTVPNILTQYVNDQDPYLRRVVSYADEVSKRSSVEGRRALPLIRDLAGQPVKQEWLWGTRFTGFRVNDSKVDPVADELWRLEMGFSRPSKNVRGITLDEHQYSRYQQLTGYALKMPEGTIYRGPVNYDESARKASRVELDLGGKGMWEALGALIKDPAYKKATDGDEGIKAFMIRQVRNSYRDKAQVKLMGEYPEIQDQLISNARELGMHRGADPARLEEQLANDRVTLSRDVGLIQDYQVAE
jgi:hypothetical protein